MQNLFEEACDHLSEDKIMFFFDKKIQKENKLGE